MKLQSVPNTIFAVPNVRASLPFISSHRLSGTRNHPQAVTLNRHLLPHASMMQKANRAAIAQEVYAFAASPDPLARPVKEALGVIDEALETWGYIFLACIMYLR